jgi:hypothetical protein
MTEQSITLETDLHQLRTAAQQREWNTLQDTLKRLLALLDPLIALQVAAARAQDFLPTFEAYYPEAKWVRELLLTVISYASAPEELPEHAVKEFQSPGCGNYVRAVFDLARAVQRKYTVFERYSHITNAIANVLLADLSHTYYSRHTDDFTRLCDPETSADERAQLQFAFWLDVDIARRDTELWLSVARDVEEKLAS